MGNRGSKNKKYPRVKNRLDFDDWVRMKNLAANSKLKLFVYVKPDFQTFEAIERLLDSLQYKPEHRELLHWCIADESDQHQWITAMIEGQLLGQAYMYNSNKRLQTVEQVGHAFEINNWRKSEQKLRFSYSEKGSK